MTTALELSLTDISRLAGVQRPVVSTWRRRAAATDAPFPKPVARVAGQERFDGDAVVHWLEVTGHGNPDLAVDAPAYSLPAGLDLRDDPALVEGLTALLCLAAITGESRGGLDHQGLRQLARAHDPEDSLLVRELDALGPRLLAIASYAVQLVDAAYGPAEAFEWLFAERYRHAITDLVVSALAPPVHELTSALAVSLARACGSEPPIYVDPTGSGSDLLVSVVRADVRQSATAAVAFADDAASRLAQRRLRAHDVPVRDVPVAIDELGPAVIVAQYPPPGCPGMTAADILDGVDELALGLGDGQRAVVLAPASVLVDQLRGGELEAARSGVLRTGRYGRCCAYRPASSATAPARRWGYGFWGPAWTRFLWMTDGSRSPTCRESR